MKLLDMIMLVPIIMAPLMAVSVVIVLMYDYYKQYGVVALIKDVIYPLSGIFMFIWFMLSIGYFTEGWN